MKLFVLFSFLFPLIFFCNFSFALNVRSAARSLGQIIVIYFFYFFFPPSVIENNGNKRRKASNTRVCLNSKNFFNARSHIRTQRQVTVTIPVGHAPNRRWSSVCWLKGRRYPSTNLQVCSGRSSACTNAVMPYYTLACIAGRGSNLVSRRAAPRPAMTICRLLRTNGLFCPWLLLTVFLSVVHFALLSSAGSQHKHQMPQSACKGILKKMIMIL